MCVRGLGRSPGARKVSKLARKFCFLFFFNYMFTLCTYLPKVQEGGVLFFTFYLLFCAICE